MHIQRHELSSLAYPKCSTHRNSHNGASPCRRQSTSWRQLHPSAAHFLRHSSRIHQLEDGFLRQLKFCCCSKWTRQHAAIAMTARLPPNASGSRACPLGMHAHVLPTALPCAALLQCRD